MDYITDFETLMSSDIYNDPEEGYYEKVNLESFIDVSLLSEISKNVDAYRLSGYMYKDRDSLDGRLTMGPIWDYNLAFGNADYYDGWNSEGWQIDVELGNDGFKIPFWWYRIWNDETFRITFNQRWQDLRESVFSEEYIMNIIDSATTLIDAAQVRKKLLEEALDCMRSRNCSSLHFLYITAEELPVFNSMGFLVRHSCQFHWKNNNYQDFDQFLSTLKRKRRKEIIRERKQIKEQMITVSVLEGDDITREHIAKMYKF